MTYNPLYTTLDSISRKLQSRLKVLNTSNTFSYNSIASVEVNNDLVLDLIEENESFLNSYLSLIYQLPLQNIHALLKKCIDNLVIADLILIYFNTTGINDNQDNSGYGLGSKQEGLQIIKCLTYDLNIVIPGLEGSEKGNQKTNSIILQGENFRNNYVNNIPVNQGIFVGKTKLWENKEDIIEFGIKDLY